MNPFAPLILVGFMGTGKTTVGKLVAERLGWRFADTDRIIEQRAGKTIQELFITKGEPYFRQLETELCAEISSWQRTGWRQTVIATGGGILLATANRQYLNAAGRLVCLNAAVSDIAARLESAADRPLLQDTTHSVAHGTDRAARLAELLDARAALYAAIPYQVETTGLTPYAVSEKVIALCQINR